MKISETILFIVIGNPPVGLKKSYETTTVSHLGSKSVSNHVFSRAADRIFLKFCMKLECVKSYLRYVSSEAQVENFFIS